MSRSLTSYVHRADGHPVLATEITPADLERGMGGVVGDYWVVRSGFTAQWMERDTFVNEYEKVASADVDADDRKAARAAIAALEPAPAAAAAAVTPPSDSPLLEGNESVEEIELETHHSSADRPIPVVTSPTPASSSSKKRSARKAAPRKRGGK